jgi:hypothetical protein
MLRSGESREGEQLPGQERMSLRERECSMDGNVECQIQALKFNVEAGRMQIVYHIEGA